MAEGKGTPTSDSEQDMEPGKRPPWRKRLWGWTGFDEKKLWDWVQLLGTLAIPVVVAVAAAWFSAQQSATQTQIEEERAQDAALQAYFDQMSTLLLERDLRFSTEDAATEDSKEARILARARTLTVLGRLDFNRKTALMQFLVEAELVQGGVEGGRGPIIPLTDADLSNANLRYAFGITNEELEQQAASLKGATMPNGQKYEDWLKSRSRGADGENSAPS